MRKIREVLRLRLGHRASVRDIAAACRIGRTTVNEYVHRAEAAGLGWPLAEDLSDKDLEGLLFPPRRKSDEPPRPLPDWSHVRAELLRKGVTLLLVWLEYKAANPDGYCYSRFAEMYASWEKSTGLRMLQRHKAGEKLFVDWAGLKMKIVCATTGEITDAPVFVSAMGASQYLFAKVYESEHLKCWLSGHADAFEFYGALPEVVVPDNLRTGIDKSCRYEPVLNPSYADLARFYELAVIPARVAKPRDKSKVENGVLQVERWVLAPLRDRTFFSIEEANEALAAKIAEVNERTMKGPGLSRRQLFEKEDKPAMRPLPPSGYAYAEWKRCKVAPDYHVEVDGHLYSVPFTLVGKHVDVRSSVSTVEVFHSGKRVTSHLRSLARRGPTTIAGHMPEGHRRQAEWTPQRIERWAATVGPNAAAFVSAALASRVHPEQAFRTCMGVISLSKRFDKERLDAACAKACAIGSLSYKSVKSILDKNLDAAPPSQSLSALPSHRNVRGGNYYAGGAPCAK